MARGNLTYWVVQISGYIIYHYTVQMPFPLPLDLAVALSAVFMQRPNPARFQDSET